MDASLSQTNIRQLEDIVKRRLDHEPLAYIVGEADFWKGRFHVGRGVLIPRPDSERVIEAVLAILGSQKDPSIPAYRHVAAGETLRFFDLCTGSGCLGISLSEEFADRGIHPEAILTDISEEALGYARINCAKSSCKDRIEVFLCDLFPAIQEVTDSWAGEKADLIISNPPYITAHDMQTLMPEVVTHEPGLALYGGTDGLFFYREILQRSRDYLKDDGWIVFEHGYDQGQSVPMLCREYGFSEVLCVPDYGGNPRVTIAGH